MKIMRTPKALAGATAGATAALALAAAALAGELADNSAAETEPPFSGEANVAYAQGLWDAMAEQKLVGEGAILTYPYEGTQPHGQVLELLVTEMSFEDHTGPVIVKRNYAGEMEPEELEHAVIEDRMQHLDSVTVMFQREDGYDPDTANWFWAKYLPDGSLDANPQDMALAGRVAKGADQGCIACHSGAEGDDYIFTEGLSVE